MGLGRPHVREYLGAQAESRRREGSSSLCRTFPDEQHTRPQQGLVGDWCHVDPLRTGMLQARAVPFVSSSTVIGRHMTASQDAYKSMQSFCLVNGAVDDTMFSWQGGFQPPKAMGPSSAGSETVAGL